jgi:uncharacterized protein
LILPDVNMLLYAFRSDAENHAEHRTWLEGVLNGEMAYGMSPRVLASVIRLADALAFTAVLLEQPHCQIIQPGPRHWDIFTALCRRANANGNLVQDAWLAALAIESGCEWITSDRDFARFEGLRWRAPV